VKARIFLSSILLAAGFLSPLWAADPAATGTEPTAPAAEPTESEVRARELLMQMATFLAAQKSFSVRLLGGYDVVQADGQKIQFIESREISLARPDHLRIAEEVGETRGQSILFDGARMTIWDEQAGIFAQANQPETVDDGVLYFLRDLHMRLPLAPLFTTWFPAEIEARLLSVDYVEETGVLGQRAHHIAARTATVDFQAWIADGKQPLPLRVVLTYPDAGQPQYWAQFSDWNLKPEFAADEFTLKLPKGLQQVAFAVQIPAMPAAGPDADAAPEGEQP